jgi:predicted nucleic acid-binding protein
VIVVDTSAWIESLRATESAVDLRLRELIETDAELAITEIVVAEVLAGVAAHALRAMRGRLLAFPVLPLLGLADFEAAADLYRACRDRGETLRHISDCLVAVPALRAGASVLAADPDFEAIARHSRLALEPA